MALIGNVQLWATVKDEENSFEETVQMPDGEWKTITQYPTKQIEGELIENAYVIIAIASLQILDYDRFFPANPEGTEEVEIETPRGETKDDYRVFYQYRIYDNKEHRQDRYTSPKYQLDNEMQILVTDLNLGGKNIVEWCYDHLKTQKGFEELIKD